MSKKIKTIEQATHLLECRHCVGTNRCRDYDMKCIVLKELPNNRLKILVFGERGWNHKGNVSKTRYVDGYRVRKLNK